MLELHDVRKSFGNLVAVDGVSFRVEPGTIHGLIGPNGSGKSTTMNLISGFYRPSGGSVTLDDRVISGLPAHRVAGRGLVRTFQLTRVFTHCSVRDAVRLGAIASSRKTWGLASWLPFRRQDGLDATVADALDRLGLHRYGDRAVNTLPGGLRRVLSIATALATRPKVLLLDEPLAGLNGAEKAEISGRIEQLRRDGITIVLVEHDMRSVMRLCDRITVLNFGRTITTGTPTEISRDERVIEAYLGHGAQPHA